MSTGMRPVDILLIRIYSRFGRISTAASPAPSLSVALPITHMPWV